MKRSRDTADVEAIRSMAETALEIEQRRGVPIRDLVRGMAVAQVDALIAEALEKRAFNESEAAYLRDKYMNTFDDVYRNAGYTI